MSALTNNVISSISFICPECNGGVKSESEELLVCSNCQRNYRVILGIPDFRKPVTKENSWETEPIVEDLITNFYTSNYEKLVKIRFSYFSHLPEELFDAFLHNELLYNLKGRDRLTRINIILNKARLKHALNGTCLDLGCGTGSSLMGLIPMFDQGIGVDVALEDLIIGQRYLMDHKIQNVSFVCADAQKLPFPDDTFNFINATDTIEHIVGGQKEFLNEARRVLKQEGVFCFNSPNRFNLLGKEPHVQVYGLGFLPRKWMNSYVQLLKGVQYKGKHLLSYRELRILLKRTFGQNFIIYGAIPNTEVHRAGIKGILLRRAPQIIDLVNKLFKFFTTNYQVVAIKRDTFSI